MANITRRTTLLSTACALGLSGLACQNESQAIKIAFLHGVASGDPAQDGFVIWTRVTPAPDQDLAAPIHVHWDVATDKTFKNNRKMGTFTTSKARDFTVKVEIEDLRPGTQYYYRFKVGKTLSPVGRAKTLPIGHVKRARFAVVSCSNFPFGYFNVYDHIAKQDVDAVIHLGDYLYEYGENGYGKRMGIELGRIHNPTHEIISLADYRARHAQYKAEAPAQAMHAAHAMIAIWDDHETANNSWRDGAQNHSAKEGPWEKRKAAAMQAYYEWMPVRDPKPGRAREALFRAFDYGDLLNLCTIETRLSARVREIDYNQYADTFTDAAHIQDFTNEILGDESRELLGAAQRKYVVDTLAKSKQSGQKWRLIANQVIMAKVILPDIRDWVEKGYIEDIKTRFKSIEKFVALSPLGLPMNLDAWDGYPAARARLYGDLSAKGVNDLLVVTGDTHVWWANTLSDQSGTKMGVELGGTSVTSPGFGTYLGRASKDFETKVMARNADVKYLKINTHGYIDLALTHQGGKADFVTVSTVKEPTYSTQILKSFALKPFDNSIDISEV